MDTELIRRLNTLWEPVYPYLGKWVESWKPKDNGWILEAGPFSGGIISTLFKRDPTRQGLIALSEPAVAQTIKRSFDPLCPVLLSELHRTPFLSTFSLVICRGAFFFLTPPNHQRDLAYPETGRVRASGRGVWPGYASGSDITHCRPIQGPQLPSREEMDFPAGTITNGR